MDPYMKEIVDASTVQRVLLLLAVVAPPVSILVGAVAGARHRRAVRGAAKALSVGLLGPLCYGLWHLYSYLVRCDPATGYVGLHKVKVLALNMGIFVAVGVILGLVYSRVFASDAADSTQQTEAGGAR